MTPKLLLPAFLAFSSAVVIFCIQRKKTRHRLWHERVTFKKISKRSDLGHCFGLDIGGTLAKIVYFESHDDSHSQTEKIMKKKRSYRERTNSLTLAATEMTKFVTENEFFGSTGRRDIRLQVHSKTLNGVFHFIRFESNRTPNAIEYIANKGLNQSLRALPCTGGGARKYCQVAKDLAGIDLVEYNEMECMILGLNLLLTSRPDEVYTYEDVDFNSLGASRMKILPTDLSHDIFPYLLVSIGSGVSLLLVRGPNPTDFERVSGSSIGGGTYWGLCRLLTSCQTFDEALDLSVHGSNMTVDMSVGDIYGGPYEKIGLPAKTVASSFGKMMNVDRSKRHNAPRRSNSLNDQDNGNNDNVNPNVNENPTRSSSTYPYPDDADFARALLVMITQNIGQIAFLCARLNKTKRIYFVGNFLRHNQISARTLAYAINYWSNGEMEARFCKHDGYLGALGAFCLNAEVKNVHGENFRSFRAKAL